MNQEIIHLDQLGMGDVEIVGGKNASLGEMIRQLSSAGLNVPGGFATTASAYRAFLHHNDLHESIYTQLQQLNVDDVVALAAVGDSIRQSIRNAQLQPSLEKAIRRAYDELGDNVAVAVRSSATAEDLPDASFAGQQETFLNIVGINAVLSAVKEVFASLFNDRAIAYRVHQNFDHQHVALSAGIQRMVRSDLGCSGVMFTVDTESGFEDVVFVTAAYGLGETVVQGAVNPDEYYVFKPSLTQKKSAILRRNLGSKKIKMIYSADKQDNHHHDRTITVDVAENERHQYCISTDQVEALARQALVIEKHYQRPMDIEWALDGIDQQLYIVQARPETVKSRSDKNVIERYELLQSGNVLCEGRAIGHKVGQGQARLINDISQMEKVQPGDILVTDMTDPDWEPIMKRASAIVTNRGGRTCHAAIIARELGIPAVVGCGNATSVIQPDQSVTVSCAQGDDGFVYDGALKFKVEQSRSDTLPELPVNIMLNVGNPNRAFDFSFIPNSGVGLARLEFIISNTIGIHPRALLEYDQQSEAFKQQIANKIQAHGDPVAFYVDKLVEGVSQLGAAFYPKPVIVRLSDFKSNEYANLLGGERYEPSEENPMIGFRGASRYVSDSFRACFELECRAIKRVRETMGLENVEIMIPFTRTLEEAREVIELLEQNGLKRGQQGLRIIMMCEIPSNALLASEFLQYFDGFSIGSNDLTQLTLGIDRDSALVAHRFDERDPALKILLHKAIQACLEQGKYVGICGQGPSDYPDFAHWLMQEGIHSISLNPDTVIKTQVYLGKFFQSASVTP